jgi:HTH-type transcriptional regulator, transcriptional repressor of NAD biosynthesis genes
MSKYGDIPHGLCPNCFRDMADCVEYNGGWYKCKKDKKDISYLCPVCFNEVGKCNHIYKSAYVLGKFMPFHLGHKYLIDTALKHSRKVTVLVGTLPTESIPGEVRYNWIKETYQDNSRVEVKWCNEVLPEYPEEHPDFWNIWVDVAKRYCPSDIDVIFTSELYGDTYSKYLGIKHHLVDLERKTYPVSGTLTRNETFKYWDYIPDNVKPYFVKRVAFMGPESSGKTTLSNDIANFFKTQLVEEYGRTVYEQNGNHVDVEDFITISIGRQKLEDEKRKKADKILICDTEDMTTYYLSKEYYPNDYQKVEDFLLNEINRKSKYDLYILLKPDFEGVQDGTRIFLNEREKHYQIIKDMLIERSCNFVEIGGSWSERFYQSISQIHQNFFL